jgi:hypothetical protein
METVVGKDKDGNEVWENDSGYRFKVIPVKRHSPDGSHWRYTDESPCCGRSICRMCDDRDCDTLDENAGDSAIEFKEIPVDDSEIVPKYHRTPKTPPIPAITLDSFQLVDGGN